MVGCFLYPLLPRGASACPLVASSFGKQTTTDEKFSTITSISSLALACANKFLGVAVACHCRYSSTYKNRLRARAFIYRCYSFGEQTTGVSRPFVDPLRALLLNFLFPSFR